MENKSVSKNRGFASWMDDFVNALAKKAQAEPEIKQDETHEEEEVVLAEVNIHDLDKVVWHDETFYVRFKETGADILNEFGNTVQTLKGLHTIEEVDKALNEDVVVAEVAVEETKEDSEFEDELVKAMAAIEEVKEEESEEEVKEAAVEEVKEEEKPQIDDKILEAIIAGFEEMEKTVAGLTEKVSAMEQQYARSTEIQDLNNHSAEEEVKHFTDAADATAEEINKEQNVDLSTPAGRVELSQQPSEVEQLVTEEVPTEEVKEEQPKDEVQEEVVTEEAKEETTEVEETKEESELSEEDFEKVEGKDEKIFQNGICPVTGEELVKSKTAGNFLGIYSPQGGTEYAVNLKTGEIYRFKG